MGSDLREDPAVTEHSCWERRRLAGPVDQISVLMVTGEYPPRLGGVGDYTARLSAELERAGARVVVLTHFMPEDVALREEGAPEVLRTVAAWTRPSWHQVKQTIRSAGCSLVHIQYQAAAYDMAPAVHLLPAYLRLSVPGVKVATTFHDLRPPYLFAKAGALRTAAVHALDRFSHASVATNRADLEKLGGIMEGSGRVARRWLIPIGSNVDHRPPSGFDRESQRRQLGVEEGVILLSHFGFMNDSKGVEFLLQALGLLSERGLPVKLLVVGGEAGDSDPTNNAYSRRILQLIRSRRLENRVSWTGFISPEQVSASLLSSDLCVLPFRDGASLRRGSLLAALAHALPVVTTYPEHAEPLLRDGENVVMARADSPAALADAIDTVAKNGELRRRLSAGAASLARHFAWGDIASRHLEMYKLLLG
ncbi:MAG: glycosyltransferase [Actinobacteria bacterium]|nr:glycosyltransferase [Actinomycetota bacterium]